MGRGGGTVQNEALQDTGLRGGFAALCLSSFLQIFLCGRKHQLDTVKLVDLARTGVIVDRYDVGERILSAQLLDHALADYVIWQAGEWLCADNVIDAGMDELKHLSGQEPAFSGLIAK